MNTPEEMEEDEAIGVPAAQRLRSQGLEVEGPAGADALLARRRHGLYVAMLHDQGHIPVKLLAPNAASALSVGSDTLLASVGHGSASRSPADAACAANRRIVYLCEYSVQMVSPGSNSNRSPSTSTLCCRVLARCISMRRRAES